MAGRSNGSPLRNFLRAVVAATVFLPALLAPGRVALSLTGLPHPVARALAGSTTQVAYFLFDYPPNPQIFTIQLTSPALIQEARDILSGQQPERHIMGTIVKAPASYNLLWSYHLDPASISFFDYAPEVCDATIQYVQDHLNEACSAFLPGCVWCPWDSRLIAEVQAPLSFSIYLPAILR